MGDDLMRGNLANPDGYFEDWSIVRLHDRVLRYNDTSWQHKGETNFQWRDAHSKNLKYLIQDRSSQRDLWGFKDPRVCLFLPVWKQAIPNMKVLVVFRHFSYCISSLYRRAGRSLLQKPEVVTNAAFWKDPNLALAMWIRYNLCLIDYVQKFPSDCTVVAHDAFLDNDFDLISHLNETFKLQLKHVPKDNVFKAKYTKNEPVLLSSSCLDSKLIDQANQVWETLQQLSVAPSKTPAVSFVTPEPALTDYLQRALNIPASSNEREGNESVTFSDQEMALADTHRIAIELLASSDAGAARDFILNSLEHWPANGKLYAFLARAYRKLKREELALHAYSQAIVFEPSLPWIQNELASLFLELYRINEAQRCNDIALKGNKNNPRFHMLKARILLREGMPLKSLEVIDRAESLIDEDSPLRVHTAHFRMKVYEIINTAQEQIGYVQEMVNKYPENLAFAEIYYRILKSSGHVDAAKLSVDKALLHLIMKPEHIKRLGGLLHKIENEQVKNSLCAYLNMHLERVLEPSVVTKEPPPPKQKG